MRPTRPGLLPEALVVPLLYAFVAVRLIQDIDRNSLWVDEAFTLGFAYLSQDVPIRWAPLLPRGPVRWIGVLSTAFEPHFPTHYVLTRLISSAFPGEGMAIERFVRLPSVLMLLVPLLAVPAIAAWKRADALGWLLAVVLLAGMVADPAWQEHANEARTYGIMATLGVAMVAALHFGAMGWAAGFGFALMLIHPFGLFVGLAPAAVILARRGAGLSRRGFRVFLVLSGLVLAVVATWLVLKFGLRPPSASAAAGARSAGREVLRAIGPWHVAACLMTLGGALAMLRRRQVALPSCMQAYLVMTVLLAVFAGLLLLAPVQAFARYVTWLNPVLVAVAASCMATAIAGAPGGAWVLAVRAAGVAACVLVAVTASRVTFGPVWGNDLRGAARYLNDLPEGPFAVIATSAEALDFPPAYRAGLACFRGGQIVPYLSESLRRHMACGRGHVVSPPADAMRVYLVREPVAWTGGRQVDLLGFAHVGTHAFGAATIEVFDRTAPPAPSH